MTATCESSALAWPVACRAPVEELPSVLLLQILVFLDHSALHAAEKTSRAVYELVRQQQLWREVGSAQVSCSDALNRADLWKKMACMAQRPGADDKKLLGGIRSFSSADRPSESPVNTLAPSRCWAELRQLSDSAEARASFAVQDLSPLGMTLGERIQHRCGCSTGYSCYWSSSASTHQNATEFIEYALNGPCVVGSVQILPYRVFWHPDSPTYAPQRVRFEFFDVAVDDSASVVPSRHRLPSQQQLLMSKPFYTSPEFDVLNDMTLQEFALPKKVAVSKTSVMRIQLLGRHQAQTFELPQLTQRTGAEEDTRPKYYCCLSYVNVVGLPWKPVMRKKEPMASVAALPVMSPSVRMATSLAEYMTACYDEFLGRTRRWQW